MISALFSLNMIPFTVWHGVGKICHLYSQEKGSFYTPFCFISKTPMSSFEVLYAIYLKLHSSHRILSGTQFIHLKINDFLFPFPVVYYYLSSIIFEVYISLYQGWSIKYSVELYWVIIWSLLILCSQCYIKRKSKVLNM